MLLIHIQLSPCPPLYPPLFQRTEAELQADEDDEAREASEARVAVAAATQQHVAAIVRTFYCELCVKQYANAAELDVHLSSVRARSEGGA